MNSRREFVKKGSILAAGITMASSSTINVEGESISPGDPMCYFSKHLQWLDFDDLGIVLNEAGFDGADLTVRPGGHVEPEKAASDLPNAVTVLRKRKISVPMVVTSVSDASQKGLDDLLMALSDNGVRYYRMGYLNYNYSLPIKKNIELFHDMLAALADKNAKYTLCGVYQNHAGTRLGASIWDLMLALDGIEADHLGCQFDVRHATFEGGRSWENDFRAISGHIRTTVVKDFHWFKNEKGQWTNKNTLMGEGMVDFNIYFKLYDELQISGPISNHSEYPLITRDEEGLPKKEKMKIAIGRLRQDVAFTRKFLS